MSATLWCRRPRSSSNTRSSTILRASRSPSCARSPAPTPIITTRPWPISATASSPTVTEADRTRWTTALRSSRRSRSSLDLVQHPRVVAADDRLDLARGEVAGGPDGHALAERQARDVRHLAEAVAMLKEELSAVDLDQLSAIGAGGGHDPSIAESRATEV